MSRKIGEESDHIALQNISKKYLKEKTLKHKLLQNINFKRDTDNTTSLTNNKLLALTKHINPENSETKHEHRLLRATGNSDFITLLRTGSSDYNTRDRSLKIKSKKIGSHICTTPI